MVPECHHIKTSGGKCGSPAPLPRLVDQPYCYFHSRLRQRSSQPPAGLAAYLPAVYLPNDLANLEDRRAIQRALTELAKAIADHRVEPKRAGLILYALQIASGNARKDRFQRKPSPSQPLQSDPPKVLIPARFWRLSSIESAMERLTSQLKPLKPNWLSTEMGSV